MTRHNCRPILIHHDVIWRFKKFIAEPTIGRTQRTVTVMYVRFKVTTCLYLSPNNRARSLSTLIAVSVSKDTEHKRNPVRKAASYAKRQIFHRSFTVDIQAVTTRGSEIIPTHRSVDARVRNKSLDGAWSEDSLWRATRISAFPRNAVMDRKLFITERHISWLWFPPAISGAQACSP